MYTPIWVSQTPLSNLLYSSLVSHMDTTQYTPKVYSPPDSLVSVVQPLTASAQTVLSTQSQANHQPLFPTTPLRTRGGTLYGDNMATSCISSVTNLTLPNGNPPIPSTQLGLCALTGLFTLPARSGYRPNILVVLTDSTTIFLLNVC